MVLFFTFGNDPSNWWLRFDVQNKQQEAQSVVLRLNRKNIDEYTLYQVTDGQPPELIGKVGAQMEGQDAYALTNGYHFNLTLTPGSNRFYAKACNRIGSMHLSMSLHTLNDFQRLSREQVLLFGLFVGVMFLSCYLPWCCYTSTATRFTCCIWSIWPIFTFGNRTTTRPTSVGSRYFKGMLHQF
ncbi:MAG: hypothetical protein IPL65_19340 [Lewinellaceae bacterium]|nr:hypothetical protein [Lewinellaceae bacterium]